MVLLICAPSDAKEAVLAGASVAVTVEPRPSAVYLVEIGLAVRWVRTQPEAVLTIISVALHISEALVFEFGRQEEVAAVGRDNDQLACVVVEVVVQPATSVQDGVAVAGGIVEGVGAAVGHDHGVALYAVSDKGTSVGIVATGVPALSCYVIDVLCASCEPGEADRRSGGADGREVAFGVAIVQLPARAARCCIAPGDGGAGGCHGGQGLG